MARRALIGWSAVLAWCSAAAAQATAPASASASAFEKQPYLQALTATSVQVRWEATETTHGRVEWGAEPDGLDRTAVGGAYPLVVTIPAATKGAPAAERTVWLQRAELTPLKPGTAYYYRVRQGGETSETFSFRTPAAAPLKFRFVVSGDAQTDTESHRKVALAIRQAKPAFRITTGDLVSSGSVWPQWSEEFFRSEHPLTAEVPLRVCVGNHDGGGEYVRALFDMPGPERERYYRFDYGPARFCVLDFDASRPKMFAWLEYELNAAPRPAWKFIFVHFPPFNGGAKRSYSRGWERERLTWLCQRYGVDLVFSGHDHVYMRTEPIVAYRASPGQATTYVVTGGGGGGLFRPGNASYSAIVRSVYHYCAVDIDGRKLTLSAVSADTGETVDTLNLEKDARGELVAPADYRSRALEVASINALETLRRDFTAWGLPPVDAGKEYPLERQVFNAFDGPVKVTVTFKASPTKWEAPAPVTLTLPPHAETPFRMVLKARQDMDDYIDAGRVNVEYVLPDGRTGVLRGEGLRIAERVKKPPTDEDQE